METTTAMTDQAAAPTRPTEEPHMRTEIRDGMAITWHQPIVMSDGVVLRADVYRPIGDGPCPVILSYGTYAKGLSYQEAYAPHWKKMVTDYPEVLEGSSNKYQSWEVVDPERWVPHGYAVVRVDSRGAGWSEGLLEPFQPRETEDGVECVEWAGTQPWSNGRVGITGISYYCVMAWRIAERQPAHLAAILPWEGLNDYYRDIMRHGGILSDFAKRWAMVQSSTVQYGVGERARRSVVTGESVAGPVTLTDEQLAARRADTWQGAFEHPFDDEWFRSRSADLSKVICPVLTCANWGGQGVHPRGNFNGFLQVASTDKWLEVHGDTHWSLFHANYGLDIQKRFFDRFLMGIDNGWSREQPPVLLNVRHADGRFVPRAEQEWPLARTAWTTYYLDPQARTLGTRPIEQPSPVTYEALGEGVQFAMPPLREPTEVTGPITAKLFISSSTADADLFLTVQAFDPDGNELTFQGALDPNTPIAQGWLRASHRRCDAARSKPWQPWHPHDRAEPLAPGAIYKVDVEILPTCLVLPEGWQLKLWVRGRDYEYRGVPGSLGEGFHFATRGTGGSTHTDPHDRPPETFGGEVTIHASPQHPSHLVLPIIPPAG